MSPTPFETVYQTLGVRCGWDWIIQPESLALILSLSIIGMAVASFFPRRRRQ